jgi:hypothetical protein
VKKSVSSMRELSVVKFPPVGVAAVRVAVASATCHLLTSRSPLPWYK